MTAESITPKRQSEGENTEKSFFHQAAIKGYETEIANLKKEIEQLQESSKVCPAKSPHQIQLPIF